MKFNLQKLIASYFLFVQTLLGTLKILPKFVFLEFLPINYLFIGFITILSFPPILSIYSLFLLGSILAILSQNFLFIQNIAPFDYQIQKGLGYLTLFICSLFTTTIIKKQNLFGNLQTINFIKYPWIITSFFLSTLVLINRLITLDFGRYAFTGFLGPLVFSRLIIISLYLIVLPDKNIKKFRFLIIPFYFSGLVFADSKIPIFGVLISEIILFLIKNLKSFLLSIKNLKLNFSFSKKIDLKSFIFLFLFLILIFSSQRLFLFFDGLSTLKDTYDPEFLLSIATQDDFDPYANSLNNSLLSSESARLLSFYVSIPKIMESPLFGFGLGSWQFETGLYWMHYPHNIFVELFFENGLISIPLILVFLYPIFKIIKSLYKEQNNIFKNTYLRILIYLIFSACLSGSIQDLRWFVVFATAALL